MIAMWNQIADILTNAILAYAQVFNGNLGAGILVVTFLARLALVPITVRLGRIMATHQQVMKRIQPELDRIKHKFAKDAQRMQAEMQKVFSREGISPVPVASCLGTLAQAPVLLALYSGVSRAAMMGGRFAWIRDISQPNLALTVVVAGIGAISAMFTDTTGQNRHLMMILPTVMTLIVLSKMSAGVALYWGMSNAFGAVQGFVARHNRQ